MASWTVREPVKTSWCSLPPHVSSFFGDLPPDAVWVAIDVLALHSNFKNSTKIHLHPSLRFRALIEFELLRIENCLWVFGV